MPWWSVIDTTGWPALVYEGRGLRDKWWVSDPDAQQWLRKSPRGSRPNETAIEAFTLDLAGRCGFDVAFGRATTWATPEGLARGFLSRKFHDDSETQNTGAELITGFDVDSSKARINATLDLIFGVLSVLQVGLGYPVIEPFIRMLMFDAWIGNGDRHLRNWAVLMRSGSGRLAPMFDTAGCLGAELLDDHALLRNAATDEEIKRYAHGCKSGFGDGKNVPGILQDAVLSELRKRPEWPSVYAHLHPKFIAVLNCDVEPMLDEVPEGWWSEARRTFARRLLGIRVKIVEGAAP